MIGSVSVFQTVFFFILGIRVFVLFFFLANDWLAKLLWMFVGVKKIDIQRENSSGFTIFFFEFFMAVTLLHFYTILVIITRSIFFIFFQRLLIIVSNIIIINMHTIMIKYRNYNCSCVVVIVI